MFDRCESIIEILSLFIPVRDSITNIATDSRDIRVENTDPVLDSNTLIVDPGELISGKLTRVDVSVVLSDPDGTTQDVSATIIHGIQVWNFDLQDLDGDGQWEGYVEVNPEKSGRPSLKITATDGQGDSATISQVSRTIVVNNAEEAKTNVAFVAGSGAFIILILLTSIMIARRRRIRLDDELIESWDAFREPKRASEAELEGGAVDASREVENDVWSKLEQEEGLS